MGKVRCDEFIRSDIEKVKADANFTPEQMQVFNELCRGERTDVGIYTKLCMSQSKYYSVKKKVINKIIRILA